LEQARKPNHKKR